jgi:hypothetical protein
VLSSGVQPQMDFEMETFDYGGGSNRCLLVVRTTASQSRRSIRLTPRAVESLESHLDRQLREMGILGDPYEDRGLLFTTSTGGLINPSNLRQRSLLAF